MTIGTAWIRRGRHGEELWLASDSRLGDGDYIWDACPKLMTLPRRDLVAGFSGSTNEAYPLLLQFANAIGWYPPASDGTLEFFEMVRHLERVATSMMEQIVPDPLLRGAVANRIQFATGGDTLILGGYSRAEARLALRTMSYVADQNKWTFHRPTYYPSVRVGRTFTTFGDNKSRKRFVDLLKLLLENRGIRQEQTLNFEPLEILAAMLQMRESSAPRLPMDRRPTSIGGAPQVFRIVPGAQARPMAVYWKQGDKTAVYLQGRETFSYENLYVPLIVFDDSHPQVYAPGRWPSIVVSSQENGDEEAESDSAVI